MTQPTPTPTPSQVIRFYHRGAVVTVRGEPTTRTVLDWLRGTTLLPYLATQDEAGKAAFCAALAPRLDAAYPQRPDGHGQNCCLFPFRRVFLIAQR